MNRIMVALAAMCVLVPDLSGHAWAYPTSCNIIPTADILNAEAVRFEFENDGVPKIGGEESISADVRVISATNRDIGEQIRKGKFREDLFFRINVVPIVVPPLRERIEDLPELVAYFMGKFKPPSAKQPRKLSPEGIKLLAAYRWPGNIRELKNFVERVNIMTEESEISASSVKAFLGASHREEESGVLAEYGGLTLAAARDGFERDLIAAKLRESGGNISRTAESLGVYASNLHSKMKKLNMTAEK